MSTFQGDVVMVNFLLLFSCFEFDTSHVPCLSVIVAVLYLTMTIVCSVVIVTDSFAVILIFTDTLTITVHQCHCLCPVLNCAMLRGYIKNGFSNNFPESNNATYARGEVLLS